MSVETYYVMKRGEARTPPLPEFSVVEILSDVETDDGVMVPAGSRGTIVATWADGEAYEVEFVHPIVGLATVVNSALRVA